MKTLKRIKLNQLSKSELEDREMKSLVGGCAAYCCCRKGDVNNNTANNAGGLHANLGYSDYTDSSWYDGSGCPGYGV